ncbi:MAG: CAAX amino terminal protease self- immunity [Candidatus Bathyarchaeota archaeon BA2]|nr:MAG: CAAX amino terminal protease self- immunity [Candidatus Bathyarchaeota archaeon BA2]
MAFSELKTFIKSTFLVALIVTVLFLVFSYFLAMFLGPTLFFFTPEGLNSSMLYVRELPIWIFTIVGFGVPVRLNVGLFFLLLWSAFAICLVAAWQFRESLQEVIGKSFSCPMKKLFNNCLFAVPILASMILIAVIAITELQKAGGVQTGEASLPSNPFEAFFWLSYAALAEEIGFRVIPIGAFLIIYLFWVRRKNAVTLSLGQRLKLFLTAPLFPDEGKKMVGLRTVGDFGVRGGITLGEWVMVFFTSIVFGLAHYLLGGGWEIGKITSASVVGLAMSLTYLLYGVQAPILLHWFFNHYLWFFNPSEQGGLQFVSKLYPDLPLVFALAELAIIILGVLGWLTFAILGLRKMFRSIAKRAKSRLMSLLRAS